MTPSITSVGSLGRLLCKPRCLMAAVLGGVALTLGAWTQFPGPPPPALTGSTLGDNLRHAAAATHTQVEIVQRAARDWGRRASLGSYNGAYFPQDLDNLRFQYQLLRDRFNWLGSLALQLGRPRASNAAAELDAGLNIIAELFTFLEQQFNAGTLERNTIVRTAAAFENAVRDWDRELRKNSSRLGLAW